ncbi:MAG: MFS transporter [Halocynthiibacter sp.]
MALFWRIWTAVTLVNLAVLSIFVGLATLQFDNINSELTGERLGVLAERTAAPFKAAADIGLPLSTVRNGSALLERARQTDDAILNIHVFDLAGRIVHSTDATARGAIPSEAMAARDAAAGARWYTETKSGFLSGVDIQASDGSSAGGILIVYPGDANVIQIWAMGAELALGAIGVVLFAAVFSAIFLRLGLKRSIRAFHDIDNSIAEFERRTWRYSGIPEIEYGSESKGNSDFGQLLEAAESNYRASILAGEHGTTSKLQEADSATLLFQVIDRNNLRNRLMVMVLAIVLASILAVGYAAVSAFDRAVAPELANRTRLIGTIFRSEVQRALDLGIPFDAVAGLDRYLDSTLAQFEEIERITVVSAAGKLIATAERAKAPGFAVQSSAGKVVAVRRAEFSFPVLQGNRRVGVLSVEISPLFVQTRLRNVFLDVFVLGLIATLVALELAVAVAVASVGKPMDRVLQLLGQQRNGDFRACARSGGLSGLGRIVERLNDHAVDLSKRLAGIPMDVLDKLSIRVAEGRPLRLRLSDLSDIRLALFLFSVATEIAAAFMPLFARSAVRPEWLSSELAAAAPLIVYLGAIAALLPFGSKLIRRFGARNLFLYSVPGAGVALVGLGFSEGLIAIVIWKGVMAAFYATAVIACQEYSIRAAGKKNSARAVGAFVAVIYAGIFTGSALGGLLAGRFGFGVAFLTGAALVVVSLLLGFESMRGKAGDRGNIPRADSGDQGQKKSWISGRYLALLVGVGIPMNATMVIFIWYMTPLMLSDIGNGPAEIARVMMLYSLAILVLGPTVSRLADSRIGPVTLLIFGAVVSAVSLLSLSVWSGFWPIAIAVAGIGVGHILIETPLFVLALTITGGPGPGIDALRLSGRVGAILGLAVSAVLLGQIGVEASIRLLGIVVLAGAVIYAIVEMFGRTRNI